MYRNKGKGKAVPVQAWSGPEGSRKLRFPDFMTTHAPASCVGVVCVGSRWDPTHTLQQACCCIYSLVTEVKTIIVSP